MKFRSSLGLLTGILLLNGNAVLAQEVEPTTEVASTTKQEQTAQTTEKVESTTEASTTQTQEVTTETSTTEAPKYTGWVKTSDGTWYFYNADHTMLTSNWKGDYYLEADGKMATSKWVDNYKYYVDGSGKWVPGKVKKSGWVKEGGYWYFYLEGEELLRNNWKGNYYLGADGKMATENWVDNHKYYVDKNGAWVPNRVKSAWEKIDGIWYYYENGQPVKNVWKGNYYLQEDGTMATNKWVEDYRYYVGADGYWVKDKKLKNGWVKENGTWYYYEGKEERVKNEWRGNYYLGSTGAMVTNQWVDNDKHYVGEDGAIVPAAIKGKDGWIQEADGTWYHFKNGIPTRNKWVGDYYLLADGKMATNQWVDNYRYYVGADGAWLPNPSSKGNQKEILLDLARGYIGVEQFDSRHNTMVSIYNSGKSSYSGYRVSTYDDWCDIFVSSMYQHSGLIDLIDKEAYVPQHIRLMKNKGIWIGKSTPQPGDVITFDWNIDGVADHIAIVEKVEGDRVITIEGNTSDRNYDESKVVRKSHKMNARYIIGYSRPQYK